jgi:hypothetical protein
VQDVLRAVPEGAQEDGGQELGLAKALAAQPKLGIAGGADTDIPAARALMSSSSACTATRSTGSASASKATGRACMSGGRDPLVPLWPPL